jgi:hypothetical protein
MTRSFVILWDDEWRATDYEIMLTGLKYRCRKGMTGFDGCRQLRVASRDATLVKKRKARKCEDQLECCSSRGVSRN